jgi:phage recombination protein Bet
METLPIKADKPAPLAIPTELKELYMDTYFKGLDENQALLAYREADRRGLDIEARQIFFIPRYDSRLKKNVPTPQTSIDGFRLIADRTGNYGGSINLRLTVRLKTGEKVIIPHEEYDPAEVSEIISGTVSVINTKFEHPQTATALFKGYAQTFPDGNLMGLWAKMPDWMILKCAESLALRKAFPQDLSGLYTMEEMGQAKNDGPPASRPQKTYEAPVTKEEEVKPTVVANEEVPEPTTPPIIDVEAEPVPEKPEKKAPAKKKEKTIPELIASIPVALKHRKPDFDPEILPFCEQFVLSHFQAQTPQDIPEDQREAVLSFLKNDLITHLTEHGEL